VADADEDGGADGAAAARAHRDQVVAPALPGELSIA